MVKRQKQDTQNKSRSVATSPKLQSGHVHEAPKALRRPKTLTSAKSVSTADRLRVAFVCNATTMQYAPLYDLLLRGVSASASQHGLELVLLFVADPNALSDTLKGRGINGLLLHGMTIVDPPPDVRRLPTVWVMGGRERPVWGDQVMPDNERIGRVAADYLHGKGHEHVMYAGLHASWWSGLRTAAFRKAAQDYGCDVTTLLPEPSQLPPFEAGVQTLTQAVVGAVEKASAPTGLFLTEDRLVRPVVDALQSRGFDVGPEGDVEIISCNNDRKQLAGLNPMPPTIDIRYESIGAQSVELLTRRMARPLTGRIRSYIEPHLIAARG